jgi:hypothetical protein
VFCTGSGRGATPPKPTNESAARGDTTADRWAPLVKFLRLKIKPENSFLREKNIYKLRKNLGKFVEVGNPIWNTFHY